MFRVYQYSELNAIDFGGKPKQVEDASFSVIEKLNHCVIARNNKELMKEIKQNNTRLIYCLLVLKGLVST